MILLIFGMWAKYKDGNDAVFAIGSPTLELYMASYRAVNTDAENLEYTTRAYGYELSNTRYIIDNTKCNGIYGGDDYSFWLASPYVAYPSMICVSNGHYVMDGGGYWGEQAGVKPVVCIPTTVFNSEYTLENDAVHE